MEPKPTLPLDILLHIIDLLARSSGDSMDPNTIRSLQILSLACKSMVPLCRKHLFSSLKLNSNSKTEGYNDLLSKSPDIACYTKKLFLLCNPIINHDFLDILKKHSSLHWITLTGSKSLSWNDFPESMQSSLVSLIKLPTLSSLSIYSFTMFPAAAIAGCSNLNYLQVVGAKLTPPEINQVIPPRSKIPSPELLDFNADIYGIEVLLNSANLDGGGSGPIVDFSRLQKAMLIVVSQRDVDLVYEMIKMTTRLEFFGIRACENVTQPVDLGGLSECLKVNAYRTLKLLNIGITVVGDDYDPLCVFNRELRFIAGNNILESVYLTLRHQEDVSSRIESEDWSNFDSVLTESGAFPMLRLVSVEIWWREVSRNLSDQENNLTAAKFPRLVESSAVFFDFFSEIQ